MSQNILKNSVVMVGFDEPGILIMPSDECHLEHFSVDVDYSDLNDSAVLNFSYDDLPLGKLEVFLEDNLINLSVVTNDDPSQPSEYQYLNSQGGDLFDICNSLTISNGVDSYNPLEKNISTYTV